MDSRLIIIALMAYLLGSIPFGYILVKLFLKQDIRETGSGNIGATNVARSGKKGLAIATLLLDAAKGALAVLLAHDLSDEYLLGHAGGYMQVAALFAIVGHVFPFWLKFRGGKGVATAVGAFALVSPVAALSAVVCFISVFAVTRYVSLSSIAAAVVFPFIAHWFLIDPRPIEIFAMTASSLLIIAKHHSNIRRLLGGTEPKFGKKAIGSTDPIETEKNL